MQPISSQEIGTSSATGSPSQVSTASTRVGSKLLAAAAATTARAAAAVVGSSGGSPSVTVDLVLGDGSGPEGIEVRSSDLCLVD